MDIGMLWYDEGPAKLKERLQRAVEYYTDKYGRKPNLCLVNPEMLNGDAGKFNGVQLRAAPAVMKDHFWLGVEERAKTNGNSASEGKPKAVAKAKTRAASKRKSAAPGQNSRTSKKQRTKKKAD